MNEPEMQIGKIVFNRDDKDFLRNVAPLKISSTLVPTETVFGSDELLAKEKAAQIKAFHAMIDESSKLMGMGTSEEFLNNLNKIQTPEPKSAFDTQIGGGHYKSMKIQPTEFIVANGIGFLEGNCIKYICRYKMKNGLEDLKKAKHYLEMMIEIEETKND